MKILVVDDEKNIRDSLVKLLAHSSWEAKSAMDGAEAKAILQEETFDLVLADLRMPGLDGLGLLQWCQQEGPDIPLVMMSAHGDLHDAVKAMRCGARDYVTKPFDPDELELRLVQALEAHKNSRLASRAREMPGLVPPKAQGSHGSSSPAWLRIEQIIAKAAPSPSLILIHGESGTGKEVLAKRIHGLSPRSSGPFVAVNVGGLPEALLESELFGYEKGAFTGADRRKPGMFEVAAGGTIFLDEIGDMPLSLQVKLLRVIQERTIQRLGGTVPIPVEARMLAATNRDLQADVRSGRFREDLYYRLNVVPITLPALRERRTDLPWLCGELLAKIGSTMGRRDLHLGPGALEALERYDFPGNIRELENLLERAVIFSESNVIAAEDLDLPMGVLAPLEAAPSHRPTLRELERQAIMTSLDRCEGNQTLSARELGISRRTLFNKLREYGL